LFGSYYNTFFATESLREEVINGQNRVYFKQQLVNVFVKARF